MPGLRAELRLENVSESPLGELNGRIESVSDVYAVDRDLYLSLDVESRSKLRDIRADIEEEYGPVSIERIRDIDDVDRDSEYTQIDLRKLTDRQHEVVETAYRMGYFGYPRDVNATEVATSLGITSSTFTEHLNTAQAKIFREIFQEE